MSLTTPIRPGTVSTSSVHESDLNKRVRVGGTEYILVKASADIAAVTPGGAVEWSGLGTIGKIADAAATKGEVAGVIPADAEFTSLSTGDYLLVVRRGLTTAETEDAVAAYAGLAVHGSDAKLDDATVTDATTIAWAAEAAGSAGTISVFVDLP